MSPVQESVQAVVRLAGRNVQLSAADPELTLTPHEARDLARALEQAAGQVKQRPMILREVGA